MSRQARPFPSERCLVTAVTFTTYTHGRSLLAVKKIPLRPCVAAVCVAFFLAVIVFSALFSSAQEQPDGNRKIVSKVAPAYPELARKLQIHGTVRVEVAVLANGKVRLAEVIGGNPLLAKSAVEAIQQWKWEPAPQETKELVELNFFSR